MFQWDIVCDRSILGSISSSIYFAGMFVGILVFGVLSDKFGRKPTLFLATLLASMFGMCCGFSPSFEFYCVFKVLVGTTAGSSSTISFCPGGGAGDPLILYSLSECKVYSV